MLQQIRDWAGFLRDIGLIVGMPTLVVVGVQLYGLQVDALEQQKAVIEERNRLLEETQYDRALDLIRSQKELFEMERGQLQAELAEARRAAQQDQAKIAGLEEQLSELESAAKVFDRLKVERTPEGGIKVTTPTAQIGVRG